MNLKGIISISGKPGLFKVIGQSKERLIVESLIDGKRMPAFASQRISALEDITMYTTEDDALLGEVVQKIYDKEGGKACIDANESAEKLHAYFKEILPNYDSERVYNSDLKKLYAWYNLLQSTGTLDKIVEETAAAEKEAAKEEKKSTKKESTDTTEKKETKEKKTAKSGEKKTTVKKTKTAQPKMKETTKAKSAAVKKTTTPKRGA